MKLNWYCNIIKHVIYCNIKSLKYHINSNITAADGSRFRYAVTDDGKPGCIVTGEDGADTVIPFSNGAKIIDRSEERRVGKECL